MLLGYNHYREDEYNSNAFLRTKSWMSSSWRHVMVASAILAALYSIVGSPLYFYHYNGYHEAIDSFSPYHSTNRNQAAINMNTPFRHESKVGIVQSLSRRLPNSSSDLLDSTIQSSPNRVTLSLSDQNAADDDHSSPWVIFYNIYIPPDSIEGRRIALDIVKEQIKQVSGSYAATSLRRQGRKQRSPGEFSSRLEILYNTIGGELDTIWMSNYCQDNGLRCHRMQHYETGHEMVTLDRLHEYCQMHDNKDKIAIYIHTKGSFHRQGSGPGFHGQDHWRRHMTAASLSEPCLTHLGQDSDDGFMSCNACGMLFQPFPAEHFAGNSWAAKCSYVKDLLPSSQLTPKRAHISESPTLRNAGLSHDFFPWAPPYLGTDRYLGEHWVGTLAPDLRPCDVSRLVSLGYWLDEERDTELEFVESTFAKAPRFSWNNTGWAYQAAVQDSTIVEDNLRGRREFFLLPGRLYKWWMEYNTTPPSDSWIWEWYPDGEYWKHRLSEPNTTILDLLLEQKKAAPRPTTTRKSNNHQQNLVQSGLPNDALALNLTSSPPFAIFYSIFTGPGDKSSQIGKDLVKEQLAEIVSSDLFNRAALFKKQPPLYYNTIGERLGSNFVENICNDTGLQDCRFMNHYVKGNEDKTLNRVQQFCARNPAASVAYVHNRDIQNSGLGFEGQDRRWRRPMIDAVLGKDCLRSVVSNSTSTCNVCGLLFQPLPSPHFPGNMFAAKCNYVKELLVSWELVPKRRRSLHAAKTAGLSFDFFPNHEAYTGKGRYLSEQWIGTHPALVPCDVSGQSNLGYWLSGDRDKSEFHFSLAPRFNFSDKNWAFQESVKSRDTILADPDIRRKEFFLLGGLLHRWFLEYGAPPDSDSWVWSWFVDGSFWKSAVDEHGREAVNRVVSRAPSA